MGDSRGALACSSCGEESLGRARFCWQCGAELPEAPTGAEALEGERRHVSVLFADLSGFTAYSEETDPEEVRALADAAAQGLGEIVERHGGVVDKIIGDAVMAVWGAPLSHEDDAIRAVRAALEMQRYFDDNQERFAHMALSVGINTGEAMYAPVGSDGRYTVIGDTVNTAARLEGAAERGTVYVGEATYRASSDAINYESLDPITAKNKREPVRVWRAVSIEGESKRRPRRRASLVGRDVELSRLLELWDRARAEQRPYQAAVVGDAGLGKSRLVEEVTSRLRASSRVYRGHCLSYGEGITYWPVVEVIKEAASIKHDDGLRETSEKLGAFLERLEVDDLDELRTMAGAVSNLLGVPTTPRGTYRATEISKAELQWGLRRVLEELARDVPVVLVIEDLHWAEPGLLDLVGYLADHAEAPVVMLGTARPDYLEAAAERVADVDRRRVIELQPLSDDESAALIGQLLGIDEIPGGSVGAALHRAAGNPLFLEETVQMLADEGLIDDAGGLSPRAADAQIAVPVGLQALVDARLDRLPDTERRVLLTASVIGDIFWEGAVRELMGGEVAPSIDALADRGFLVETPGSTVTGEREWTFHHGLLREVAYGRLPKADRFKLHARFATWIRALPDVHPDLVEILAHHFERACLLAGEVSVDEAPPVSDAMRALVKAAERAKRRDSVREASRFYERALAVAGDGHPETVAEVRGERARTLAILGKMDVAYAELADTVDAAAAVDRADVQAWALVNLGTIDKALGRGEDAAGHIEAAGPLVRDVTDPNLTVQFAVVQAGVLSRFEGDPDSAIEPLRRELVRIGDSGEPEIALTARITLGSMLSNAGRLEEAEREFEHCRRIGREMGTVRYEAIGAGLLAHVMYYRGPRSEAEKLAHQAVTWFQRATHAPYEAQVLKVLVMLTLARGAPSDAERWAQRALPIAERLGNVALRVELVRHLARALVHQERFDEGRIVVAQASDEIRDGDRYSEAMARVAEGMVASAAGDRGAVPDSFDGALDLLEELAMTTDLLDVRLEYAEALLRLGESDAARGQLLVARDAATDMEATAVVEDIDTVLAEYGDAAGTVAS